jgi:hypothetical protein
MVAMLSILLLAAAGTEAGTIQPEVVLVVLERGILVLLPELLQL